MRRLRYGFIVLGLLFCLTTTATASVSVGIGIGLPNVSIGLNLGGYPDLRPIPGYPVYYAPNVYGNYFFYDGMYWAFWDDNWYASSWYNGPWALVDPYAVPVYLLRVPVRYYRQPPVYFRGWGPDRPPRWGQHWGRGWEQRRHGWDRWDRSRAPRRAPLPTYQRSYTGDRYPSVDQQRRLHRESYRYEPKNTTVRKHLREVDQRPPAPVQRQERPEMRGPATAPPAQMRRGPEHERQAPMRMEQRGPQGVEPRPMEPRHEPRMDRMERQERMPMERMDRGGGGERGGGPERGRGPDKDEGRGR
ncbi:hypothetical protein KOM00_00545 [Geomonas sp. Red69]|uniref:hypothetical protein n=1 Tax=Geomonas diazotrophica TaxID=2843197 RepID=UPI001C0F4474|nr:hypothetical protein [Geomonas diazotrophica]MBU5635217.1 hypothetical protein [Geomonas diazotrophica]